jgi:hypothetical protein
MLSLKGIRNEEEQGISILHDDEHEGVLTIGTNEQNELEIKSNDRVIEIRAQEIAIMSNLSIDHLRNNDYFSYLTVNSRGHVILQSNGYFYFGVLYVTMLLILQLKWI